MDANQCNAAGIEGYFELPIPVEKCRSSLELAEIMSVFDNNNTIARMKQNCPLIDFAGPGRKVYQVTISGKHDFKAKKLIDLLVQQKSLENDESATPQELLEFYWVVPYGKESDWKKISSKTTITITTIHHMLLWLAYVYSSHC